MLHYLRANVFRALQQVKYDKLDFDAFMSAGQG